MKIRILLFLTAVYAAAAHGRRETMILAVSNKLQMKR